MPSTASLVRVLLLLEMCVPVAKHVHSCVLLLNGTGKPSFFVVLCRSREYVALLESGYPIPYEELWSSSSFRFNCKNECRVGVARS